MAMSAVKFSPQSGVNVAVIGWVTDRANAKHAGWSTLAQLAATAVVPPARALTEVGKIVISLVPTRASARSGAAPGNPVASTRSSARRPTTRPHHLPALMTHHP